MAGDNQAMKVDLPIRDVTLMEDRARVTRAGRVRLPAGLATVWVEGVALVAADKTLQGRVRGASDGTAVVAAKIHREHRERQHAPAADLATLCQQIQDLQLELQRAQERQEQCQQDVTRFQDLERRALREIAADAAWGKANRPGWETDLQAVRDRETARLAEAVRLRATQRHCQAETERLQAQLAALGHTTREFDCRIEASIDVRTAGEFDLEFEYVVPGACWRPAHTATLKRTKTGMRVEIEAEGCVWQWTGEPWTNVQLCFSTQRPSLGVKPPELDEDLLTVQRKPDKLVVEARDQELQTAGLGRGRQTREMPGIDDGGEALNLRGAAPATVPSDGQPYRVTLFTMASDAETDLVCMPELEEAAILQSTQGNTAKQPLLAGPVDLIRESGKVGRTQLEFVAPGERFKLGWGPDVELRVNRWQEDEAQESSMLSAWEEEKKKVRVRLSNIGAEAKAVKLSERVPVSELQEVEIKAHADETTDKRTPDENGLVTWTLKLEPFGRAACDLAYTVRKKKSVEGL